MTTPSESDRPSIPLAGHVLLLSVLLLSIVPFMEIGDSAWINDEGAYAMQVHNLERGDWARHYVGARFDPDSRWLPRPFERIDDRVYPYVKHPAYPALLYASTRVLGEPAGLYVPSMIGVVLAACVAWLLAGEIERRARPWAFWAVAVSPLLIDGYQILAHTLSGAISGLAVLMAVRIAQDGPRPGRIVLLLAALVAGISLRAEGQLLAIAIAICLGTALWRSHGPRVAAILAGSCAVITFGARRTQSWVIGRIVDRDYSPQGLRGVEDDDPFLLQRLEGLWRTLLSGNQTIPRAGVLLLGALSLVIAAGFALRQGSRRAVVAAAAALVAALALYSVRFSIEPTETVSGLFSAWPIAALGLVAAPWRHTSPSERLVLSIAIVFGAGVVATQYAIGGGLEWGGRYFSPSVVPLAVVVAAALLRRLELYPLADRLPLLGIIVALALFPASRGLVLLHENRSAKGELYDELEQRASGIVLVDDNRWWYMPTQAWRLDDEIEWMTTYGAAPEAIRHLYAEGRSKVTVIRSASDPPLDPTPYRVAHDVTGDELSEAGLQMLVLRL